MTGHSIKYTNKKNVHKMDAAAELLSPSISMSDNSNSSNKINKRHSTRLLPEPVELPTSKACSSDLLFNKARRRRRLGEESDRPLRTQHLPRPPIMIEYRRSYRVLIVTALLVSLVASFITISAGFQLDGSQNSFYTFRKWYTGLNGTLELEFKTEQPNGLVLYTDDGGTYDFFELKLVEGALRLRYNLGGGAQIITVGRELHDGHWHKVQVLRNDDQTSLIVDGVSQQRSTKGKEFQFGKFASNSDVYVGGMPNWYNTKLALLALPSVIFEPRFRGAIRNLVYADQPGGTTRRQEMKQPRDIKCGDAPCDHGEMPPRERGLRVSCLKYNKYIPYENVVIVSYN